MPDRADRIETTTATLAVAAEAAGLALTADGRVSEEGAAILLGFGHPGSLKNLRGQGKAPVAYRIAGRVTYRLADLAEWIEARREEW